MKYSWGAACVSHGRSSGLITCKNRSGREEWKKLADGGVFLKIAYPFFIQVPIVSIYILVLLSLFLAPSHAIDQLLHKLSLIVRIVLCT